MITCGWCGVHYTDWQSQCDSCGGALPHYGQELGDRPPEAPRRLPHGFAFRRRFTQNILVIVGSGFLFVCIFLAGALLSQRSWGALLPGTGVLVGALLFRAGWRNASSTLKAFTRGRAVVGAVTGVRIDKSQSINQDHPFRLTYHFPADGHQYEGIVTTWDSTVARRAAGQPIWVLYLEEDPAQNTIYPPYR